MPDPDVALDKLYKYTLAGVNPPGSASSSGDIGQLVKYLVANPSAPTFRRQIPIAALGEGVLWKNPLIYGAAAVNQFVGVHGGTSDQGTPIWTWDSTRKAWCVGNTGGATWNTRIPLAPVPCPTGPASGSPFPSDFDLDGDLVGLPPAPTSGVVVFEWLGKMVAKATWSTGRGWGLGANLGGSNWAAATRGFQVWRDTTGWTLTTADGTTISDAVEASDTSDANIHVHRVEWEETEIRLYIDGTLKVTKTTNLPTPSGSGSLGTALVIAGADSADSNNDIQAYAFAMYYKAA